MTVPRGRSMPGTLADRARQAAIERREAEAARMATPTELQSTAALDLAVTLGLAEYGQGYGDDIPGVDPLTVKELGHRSPYEEVAVELYGITFTGSFLWGGRDWRYNLAGFWKATRRRFGLRQTRHVSSIADLDGWLG